MSLNYATSVQYHNLRRRVMSLEALVAELLTILNDDGTLEDEDLDELLGGYSQ